MRRGGGFFQAPVWEGVQPSVPRSSKWSTYITGAGCTHYAPQNTLALNQWQLAEVFAVQPKNIECSKVLRCAPSHQIVEPWPTIATEVDDFAV
jgi:hypothetical protein